MEISWRGLHGLRVMVRKIGRLNAEQKAKLHELIDPNPAFILSGKAEYEALTEHQKTQFKAAIIEDWHGGMEEALRCLEALEAEGTIKIGPDQEEREEGALHGGRAENQPEGGAGERGVEPGGSGAADWH